MNKRLSNTFKIMLLCGVCMHNSYSMDFQSKHSVFESSTERKGSTTGGMKSVMPTIVERQGMNFDLLSESIQEAERAVQGQMRRESSNPTRVLVLGTTGSGKSTLIHALAGKNLKASHTEDEDSYQIEIEGGTLPGFTVGHGISSATDIPVSWHDQRSNLVYWDCPGFLDSRGVSQEIVNAFAIDQLFSPPSRVKILLAMQASEFQGARGMDAIHRLNKLISLIPDLNQLKQSITLVITKKNNDGFNVMKMVSGLLHKAQEELECRRSEERTTADLEGAIDLLNFITHNEEKVSSFPLPNSIGSYQQFTDQGKTISSLNRNPVVNPRHVLRFDESVLFNVLMMMERFCPVPQIIQEWKDAVHEEYRGKELPALREWSGFIASLHAKKDCIDTPGKFDTEFSNRLPLRIKSRRFLQLSHQLQTTQRYLDFATRLAAGNDRPLENLQIQTLLAPVVADMMTELQSLIAHKELIEQQETETKRIKESLNKALQERTIEAQEAERQYKTLDNKLKQEKVEAELKHQALQNQLRQARSETDDRIRSEVAAEKSRYDRDISLLQSRLSSMDQSSLISNLRSRIEDLENELRRYQNLVMSMGGGGGGQYVMTPFGLMRFG